MENGEVLLHMLAGKVCSGKSTLATSLGRSSKTVIITEDEWLSKLFGDDMHGIGDYIRYSAKLRTIMEPHLVTLLRSDLSVVLDFPANTLEMRAWMRGIYEAANCGHLLHYLVSSDEECKKRLHNRNTEGDHPFSATDDQFDIITSFFVPPSTEEGFDIIVHGQKTEPE
jgi:predicted kinase